MGYDANGNMSYKLQAGEATVYEWNRENRLAAVTRNGTTVESYLYDDSGMRVKKSAAGVDSYYVNPLYEVSGDVVTKYYYFGGQRVAMRKNGVLTYLHTDHLGSTVLETDASGTPTANQTYRAYGTQRDSGPVVTDHTFTGQKQDGTGLLYYRSRYFDPVIGAFISPDTLVPDASLVSDYNRYMMTRGNPLKYSDPTGHLSEDEIIEYFGHSSEELAEMEGWNSGLVDWLADPDVQFGDVFSYYNQQGEKEGEAILALFETGTSWGRRTFRGGFYGLTGESHGVEVYSHQITSFDSHSSDATRLEESIGNRYDRLAKKTGSDYRNYYDPVEYRVLSAKTVMGKGIAVYAILNPVVFGEVTFEGGTLGLAGLWSSWANSGTSYPVILNPRPEIGGNPRLLESFMAPKGHYR